MTENPDSVPGEESPPPIGHNSEAEPSGMSQARLVIAEKLAALAVEALALTDDSDALSEKEKANAKRLKEIRVKALPDLLAQFGASAWEGDGMRVALATVVKGAISAAPDTDKALGLLRQYGFPGGVVTTMTVEFGPGESDLATQIATLLGETFHREVALERKVHSSTLQAFGREKLATGSDLDLRQIGLSSWLEATVKRK
jgi:hypothetical protein